MSTSSLVTLVLKELSCSQKDLANKVGVSTYRVKKWLDGEKMDIDMKFRLTKLLNVEDHYWEFILWTGGIEESKKWHKLISQLADIAYAGSETGYATPQLFEDLYTLSWNTISNLKQMGVTIPQKFPEELIFDSVDQSEEEFENFCDAVNQNPISKLIYEGFMALNEVWGFYAAYIYEILESDYDNGELLEMESDFSFCLSSLAFSKLDLWSEFTPKFGQFKNEITDNYICWIKRLKIIATQNRIPLRAELLDFVLETPGYLGHQAEAESLGINDSNLHPDIYMNQILTSLHKNS